MNRGYGIEFNTRLRLKWVSFLLPMLVALSALAAFGQDACGDAPTVKGSSHAKHLSAPRDCQTTVCCADSHETVATTPALDRVVVPPTQKTAPSPRPPAHIQPNVPVPSSARAGPDLLQVFRI